MTTLQQNKKYFVISDIHSFCKEMKESLSLAGFRKTNKNHILIVLGDVFDRGNESLAVYNFIMSIPKNRRILITGNHELLYFDLLKKEFPDEYDFSNGTVGTFCQIAQTPEDLLNEDTYGYDEEVYLKGSRSVWEDIKNIVREHPITKWLQSDEWKNYYELDKYIFVHSFIPLSVNSYEYPSADKAVMLDWRNCATRKEWNDATWGCPWLKYQLGYFKEEEEVGKVLVCGHWHTSDFYRRLDNNLDYVDTCGPIYCSKGLIGIDGGCRYSWKTEEYEHPQNVLVIDKKFECYDKYGIKLVESEKRPIIMTVTE